MSDNQSQSVLTTMQQLSLGLQIRDDATFDNFYIGKNAMMVSNLKQLCNADERFIYLSGNVGSGRTHLLHACCHALTEVGRQSTYIPLREHALLTPALLENLEQMHLVCLDDLDAIIGLRIWEEAIFHLYNRLTSTGNGLLVSANVAAPGLNFSLADLQSRMGSGLTFHVNELDDSEKMSALVWRAKQRGMHLSQDVSHFLLTRCSRNMPTLLSALDTLDKISLAEQRRLTIPFIKSTLRL